jgi:putative ABC transport system permease protein
MGTSARPYPFDVVQGRIYHAPNEAVAGQGMLTLLHVHVGQWVRLTVQGIPLDVHIVGRTLEPEDGGQVLSYGTDALEAAGGTTPVESYSLVLHSGADPAAVRAHLLAASGGQLYVGKVPNPAAGLGVVRWVLVGLIAVLALIGLTNLVTATAVGLREHLRDIAVLKAMGLTPRQVTAALVTGMSLLALIAVTVGTCLGLALADRLINLEGQASGIGAGLAVPPSAATIAATVVAALAGASITAFLLARKTAYLDVASVLREPAGLRPGGQHPTELTGEGGRRPILPASR